MAHAWRRHDAACRAPRQVKQKGHRADALALRAEERRDKLRKAAGRGKYLTIRRCLNGGTHMGEAHVAGGKERNIDSASSGERTRRRPNRGACAPGFGPQERPVLPSRTALGKPAGEGESPVSVRQPGAAGSRVRRDTWNLGGRCGDHPASLNTPQ